jgi:hypothetical protein
MKRFGAILLAVLLLLSAVMLTSCKKAEESEASASSDVTESPTEVRDSIAVRGGGQDLTITVEELEALEQQTKKIEMDDGVKHTLAGPLVSDVFDYLKLSLDDYAGIRFVSADGGNRVLTAEMVKASPDMMLALSIDGQLDDDQIPAVFVIPDQAPNDWVSGVTEITLYTELTAFEADTLWLYDALQDRAGDEIETLDMLINACGTEQLPAFLKMRDLAGVIRWETLGVRAGRVSVDAQGIDGRTDIVWFAAGGDVILYPQQIKTAYTQTEINGVSGVQLSELAADAGISQVEDSAFILSDTDGKTITVSGADLNNAILVPSSDGSCTVTWSPDMENVPETLGDILYITSTAAQIENEQIVETQTGNEGQTSSGQGDNMPDVSVNPGDQPSSQPSETPSNGDNGTTSDLGEAGDPTKTVVLTINGDGVSRTTEWSMEELKSLGATTANFSMVNNWPTKKLWTAEGVTLTKLMEAAGMTSGAKTITVTAADGYSKTFTKSQFMDSHYYYPNVASGSTAGAASVAGMLCWSSAEQGKSADNSLRIMLGQRGINDVNTDASVKDVIRITVSTAAASQWGSPTPSVAPGTVAAGTQVALDFDYLDSVRIYYTTDGSNPTYNSSVYNPSTTYFQPNLIQPISITSNTTIKLFVSGWGRNDSTIYTFNYTVQ